MINKNLREKLLNDKELLRRSVKENSSFSTADLLNIVADLIDYTLNDNNLDNKNIDLDLQDLIDKYKKEKESMIDSLDNLLSNVICDLENLKGEINE